MRGRSTVRATELENSRMLFNALDVEIERKEGTQGALPLRLHLIGIRNTCACKERNVGSSEGDRKRLMWRRRSLGVVDNKEDNFLFAVKETEVRVNLVEDSSMEKQGEQNSIPKDLSPHHPASTGLCVMRCMQMGRQDRSCSALYRRCGRRSNSEYLWRNC